MFSRRSFVAGILGAGASLVSWMVREKREELDAGEVETVAIAGSPDFSEATAEFQIEKAASTVFSGPAVELIAFAAWLDCVALRGEIGPIYVVDGVRWADVTVSGYVLAWYTGGNYFVREIDYDGDGDHFTCIGSAEDLAGAGVVRVSSGGFMVDVA